MSRRHARLMRVNGHVLVEDLGSYNGIRINGERIQGKSPVHDGDLIQIGDYDLAIQTDGVTLLVDPLSLQYLMGAEVDYTESLHGAQFVIRNPNAKTTCGCGSSFAV